MSSGSDRFVAGRESSPRPGKANESSWSSSPKSSPRNKQRRSEDGDAKKVQQMQAYVAWTNSQLKKLPGSKHVEDLARDMQDGVALAELIEVVAGVKISVDREPSSPTIMKDNVEKILQFISAKKIRLHHVTAKDIVSGNLKAVMRLILALAAHFKPSSVRTSVSDPRPGRRVRRNESSLSAVAAEAAAALHDVSRAAASAGTPCGSRLRSTKLLNSSESTSSIDSIDKETKASSLTQSMPSSSSKIPLAAQCGKVVKRGEKLKDSNNVNPGKKNRSQEVVTKKLSNADSGEGVHPKSLVGKKRVAIGSNQWKEIVYGFDTMEIDVRETKKQLLYLQDVLLNQGAHEEEGADDSEFSSLDGALLQEQVTILNARLDQRSSEYDELKQEYNKTREACINLQGIKQGLQSRLSDQEQVMMKLKAELLKLSFSHQAANSDKAELQKLLEDRDREIALLRSELMSKDSQLDELNKKLETALASAADVDSVQTDLRSKIKKHEVNSGDLRSQVKELQQKLRSVSASEIMEKGLDRQLEATLPKSETMFAQLAMAKISNRITYQDRKVNLLENRLLRDQSRPKLEEMETVRQCLGTLRHGLANHDPHHRTLDTLEGALASMVDCAMVQFPTNDDCRVDLKNNNYPNGFSAPTEVDETNSADVSPSTRITYYSPWAATPSVTVISKRLGEVTLGDFKLSVDRPGEYRYYFKALDPEFGTIREELVNDDDVIPGWEGKIMAWITYPEEETARYTHEVSSFNRSETDI